VSHATVPEREELLPTLEGRALCFGLVLTADQILDPLHADPSAADACVRLFASIDPGLAARLAASDVIVAEEITGTLEAVQPALAALATVGIRLLVARRFAPVILRIAPTQGIATLVTDTPNVLRTDDRLRLDLDAAKIVNLSSGDRSVIRNLGDDERAQLRTMLTERPIR
jgi:3-isopropylmalate dehydratase small subunit